MMSDPQEMDVPSVPVKNPRCPDCQSEGIRPSRGSYPRDRERIGEEPASFWRCGNCGARFLGPLAPERPRSRRGRGKSRNPRDLRNRADALGQAWKRWIFPGLVILATTVAVIYILDRRDRGQEQLVLPDS